MEKPELLTKHKSGLSFHEAALVDQLFLSNVASQILFGLALLVREGLVVVGPDRVLVVPEIPDEGSVTPVLSVRFPAVIVYLFHDLVCHSFLHLWNSNSVSERLDDFQLALLAVIHCSLLEAVNDPFEVAWGDVDVVFAELDHFLFGNLVHFFLEGPEFLLNQLGLPVESLMVVDVVWRHYCVAALLENFPILQELVGFFELDISKKVREL